MTLRLCALLASAFLAAQTRQFDLYSLDVPPGYSARAEKGQLDLMRVDQKRQFFCQFTMQPSQASLGSAASDIDAEWNLLIGKMFVAKGAPVTKAFAVQGAPDSVVRTAPTSASNIPSMISSVTVLRFPGRYVSVLFNASNAEAVEACSADAARIYGSIRLNAATPAPAAQPTRSAIPTGNTPQLFPGMPGWLPSGAGVPIPDPAFVNGAPVGLWWSGEVDAGGMLKPLVYMFLSGGVRASQPRLGGPRLYDLEGQKRQAGTTGVINFAIENGMLVERSGFGTFRAAYSTGNDANGPFFKHGGAVFRPLRPATAAAIAGHWRGSDAEIIFAADGTFRYGAGYSGRYVVDGYLIHMMPSNGAAWVNRVGLGGDMLVYGTSGLFRVK